MPNKSGINPIFDRVLIEPLEVAKKTDWGFQLSSNDISDREQLANTTGIIIALGDEVETSIIKIGDKVAYAKYAGLMYTGKDGKDYRMVNYGDLVAVLDEDMDLVDPHLKKGIK